jgi:hypothetical protein
MKSKTLAFTAITLFAALAIPVELAAQGEPGATDLSTVAQDAKSSIHAAVGDLPSLQVAKLIESTETVNDQLAFSAAISGNTVVAGAPSFDNSFGGNGPGAAYVFVKPPSGWRNMTETASLSYRTGETVANFGSSVSIDGNTVVVGASDYNTGAPGAVYVFVKPASGWANMTETAKLTASDGIANDYLGSSVSINGNTVVASGGSGVYVFVKPTSGWADMTETAKLTASNGGFNSVAISGNTVVAGAAVETIGLNPQQGAAYVFVKPASGWTNMSPTAKLIAGDGAANDSLGYSVAISGNTVVAGAYDATTSGTNQFQGAAYVFVEPASGWADMIETAKLTASDGAFGAMLGWSVDISGNTVMAGAPQAGSQGQGAAYVFAKPPTGWANMNQNQELISLDGAHIDFLGSSVSVDGTTAVAGAPFATIGSNQLEGAAYVFSNSPVGLSADSLGFGGQQVGTTSGAQSVTLTNAGSATVTISSIGVTGTGATYYAQTNTCGSSLAAGGSCTISVTFKPTQLGSEIASVTITDNAPGSPQSIALSGTGVVSGTNATLSATSLTFATQLVGATSPTKSVTLSNYGTMTLSITSIKASGDFVESNTCGSSLAVRASCTITVVFKPTQPGTRTGTLSITDNAPGSLQKASLNGMGTVVQLMPTGLGFGCRDFPRSTCPPPPQTTTLTNTGSTALSITSVKITGSTYFSQTNTCGNSVGAGKSCTITVTFNPPKLGRFTGSVSISDNGGGSPQMVSLTGCRAFQRCFP